MGSLDWERRLPPSTCPSGSEPNPVGEIWAQARSARVNPLAAILLAVWNAAWVAASPDLPDGFEVLTIMKAIKTSVRRLTVVCLAGISAMVSAEIPESDLGAFHRPKAENGGNFAAERAKGLAAGIAAAASFEKWKTFEDERVRFLYPDHEAITVEVKVGEPVPVDGDRVTSVDTSFSKAYRLTAGGETLTVLMLKDDAAWFDDGICFCGEIVYQRYLVRGGHFYRFGFLKSGRIKKMEVLGDRERLMMFEWTHSPIHEAVYRKIARSIELKRPGKWKEDECREKVRSKYGGMASLGWFGEGAPVAEVVAAIGAPTKVLEGGVRVWEATKEEDGYRWVERLSLPFANDKLTRFDDGFHDSGWESRETVFGGVPWMQAQAEPYEKSGVRGEKAEVMPDKLKAELLRLFLEKAEQPGADFDGLCQVLKTMVEQGVRDPNALGIVRKRFAKEGGHYAAWVLHEAGDPDDITLFVAKVQEAYQDTDKDQGGLSDLWNWLSFIPKNDVRYPELLRGCLNSRKSLVRGTAYQRLGKAPLAMDEKLAFVRSGLRDADDDVRGASAEFFQDHAMSEADWKLLEEVAPHEKDEGVLKEMREALLKRPKKAAE